MYTIVLIAVIFCNLYFIETLTHKHFGGKADSGRDQFP